MTGLFANRHLFIGAFSTVFRADATQRRIRNEISFILNKPFIDE